MGHYRDYHGRRHARYISKYREKGESEDSIRTARLLTESRKARDNMSLERRTKSHKK